MCLNTTQMEFEASPTTFIEPLKVILEGQKNSFYLPPPPLEFLGEKYATKYFNAKLEYTLFLYSLLKVKLYFLPS